MAKSVETTAGPEAPEYRFGDKAGEAGRPAWQATNQTFSNLVLASGSQLDSEWVLIQSGAVVGFVDLLHGTFVPMASVSYAVPA